MFIFTVPLVTLIVQLATAADCRERVADTVPQLTIDQYVGRWYQVYGDYYSEFLFQRNCKCVTADYGLLPNNSVTVQNSCRLKSPNGEANVIRGYAYRPDDNEQGKLKVKLDGVPRAGDYWVIQLGPTTFKGYFYQYAVVTDKSNFNLFVLARNVTEFKQNYEVEVLTKLESQGFTEFYNKPREIYQGTDCVYVK